MATMDLQENLDRHRRAIEIGFWAVYLCANAVVESYSVITEYARISRPVEAWEPFAWEFTSAAVTGILIVAIARLNRAWPFRTDAWKTPLVIHLLATIPFSLAHVGGMVGLRKMIYWLQDRSYDFGSLATELPYEFRKDFVTYWLILGIIYLWQYIRFLNAAQPAVQENPAAPISRIVAKKRGSEFLINADDVHWIEASGNYANLHLPDGVFPVRASMTELERRMNPDRFARVHRSFIVNLDYIVEIRPTDGGDHLILMRDGTEVRFSRRYRAALKGKLDA